MTHPLFKSLLECGRQIEDALREVDVDRFESLLVRRAEIIEDLKEVGPPSAVDPQWKDVASAYEKQERIIMAEVTRCREVLEQSLAASSRMHNAARSYDGESKRRQILNPDLAA